MKTDPHNRINSPGRLTDHTGASEGGEELDGSPSLRTFLATSPGWGDLLLSCRLSKIAMNSSNSVSNTQYQRKLLHDLITL